MIASSSSSSQPQANGTTNKVVMDYGMDFPELPGAQPGPARASVVTSAPVIMHRPLLTSATTTATLSISAAERAGMNLGGQKSIGQAEQHKCASIAAATNTKIELHESSDKSLTILITGKKANIAEAQNRLLSELQTQAKIEIKIPREYYGVLIGKEGARRKQLEQEFNSKLYLPGRNENSEIVAIVGPSDRIKQAAQRIQSIVSDLEKQATESIPVPREFYPWIRGANNETLDRLQAETGAKINIPPPKSNNETIVISGEREGVEKAAAEIKQIFAEMQRTVKSLTISIPRAQHRFVMGHQRSGLDEIFRDTQCIVELPPEEAESDTVVLRGPQARLGDGVTGVYARASSIITSQLPYPEWQKRFLLGPKGSTLQQLVPKQDRLQIEFEEGGKIFIEGPPEAVKNAHVALSQEIERLSREMASETLKVPVYLHRYLIGKQGSAIAKLKEEYDVQINIPNKNENSENIRVEGNRPGVEKAVAELRDQVAKLLKKMPTKEVEEQQSAEQRRVHEDRRLRSYKVELTVPRECHQSLIGKGGATIRELSQRFDVHVAIPKDDSETITITGYQEKAIEAKAEIERLVENHHKEVEDRKMRSYKTTATAPVEFHQRLIGPGGATIRDLSKRFDVQINIPRDETDLISISGYEEKAEQCKAEIERLVSNYQNMITREIQLDPRFHPRLIGQRGKNLRQIQSDYKVEIKMPNRQAADPSLVEISGLDEEKIISCLEKLSALEEDFLDEYAGQAQYQYRRHDPEPAPAKPQQIEITGAPWQLNSMEQFPSMNGAESEPASQAQRPSGVWGRRA